MVEQTDKCVDGRTDGWMDGTKRGGTAWQVFPDVDVRRRQRQCGAAAVWGSACGAGSSSLRAHAQARTDAGPCVDAPCSCLPWQESTKGNPYPGQFTPRAIRTPHARSVLQVFVKHPFVTTYLVKGADLMLPGAEVAAGLPHFNAGDLVAVCARGNPAPLAVGRAGMGSADAQARAASGAKGKLVEVLQVYGDCLCECLITCGCGGVDALHVFGGSKCRTRCRYTTAVSVSVWACAVAVGWMLCALRCYMAVFLRRAAFDASKYS
eukprot:366185-Chlamydomonas_euryale.AAC.5